MGEKSDMLMAVDALEDEIEAIESYKEMLESVTCPTLGKILTEALAEERTHVNAILSWINEYNRASN